MHDKHECTLIYAVVMQSLLFGSFFDCTALSSRALNGPSGKMELHSSAQEKAPAFTPAQSLNGGRDLEILLQRMKRNKQRGSFDKQPVSLL